MPAASDRAVWAVSSGDDEAGAAESQGREAEIEDLHPAVQREEDVLRLQVAMHDAACVRGTKPSGHLKGDVECGVD